MEYVDTVISELQEYGKELAVASFAVFSYISAQILHNSSHALYGSGTPMMEILVVSGVMAGYAGFGYLLTVALQEPEYVPGIAVLGISTAGVVHYASHTVAGFQVPLVGSTMGALFAGGYLLYLYLS
ncbi:MAG: hypothetical protein ABEJ56_05620 [Candidatus Nanohaloarchaea archaeon]